MVMIFILAVFASSFISDNKIFAFYSSLVSVLIYNFFFLEPIFSLKVHDSGNIITFTTMFIVGFLTAVFTRRLKLQSKELTKRAYRTAILLENSENLARGEKQTRALGTTWKSSFKIIKFAYYYLSYK